MIELLIFINIICFFSAIVFTHKNNILKNRINLINSKSNELERIILNKKYNINNKIGSINNIANSYEEYYNLAITNLQKYDESKNLSKTEITDKISQIIDAEIKTKIEKKSKTYKSSNDSTNSSYTTTYDDNMNFSTHSNSSDYWSSSSDSSSSYSGDGGSFGGGGSGGDW